MGLAALINVFGLQVLLETLLSVLLSAAITRNAEMIELCIELGERREQIFRVLQLYMLM